MAATLAADAVIPVDAVDLAVVPAAGSGSSFFCAAVVETATDSLGNNGCGCDNGCGCGWI